MASTVPRSILIINPNTTQAMTDALKPLIDSLKITDVRQVISHCAHTQLVEININVVPSSVYHYISIITTHLLHCEHRLFQLQIDLKNGYQST